MRGLCLLCIVIPLHGCGSPLADAPDPNVAVPANEAVDDRRPFLAIWCDSGGFRHDDGAPFLRVAIWNDGRIVFTEDPKRWSHKLQQGQIGPEKIAELKQSLVKTGVFERKGYCYLVPSAPVLCVMLDLGQRKQMLYWDEVETSGYGINIENRPHHVAFKKQWKAVNELALAVRPKESENARERFQRPPASWYLKPQIQSK